MEQLQRDVVANLVEKVKDFIENNPGVSLDVQINGVSIVDNGVANIPVASDSTLGVAKFGNGLFVSSSGAVTINKATGQNVKAGTESYKPIVPVSQDTSVFYGLAKAAGDTTQSSSDNVVGVYTDNALDKILQMLGVSALIGPTEGATSEHAYSQGDCFIFSGKLVKATDSIAIDDTIAIGTNCTQTTLIAEIASI